MHTSLICRMLSKKGLATALLLAAVELRGLSILDVPSWDGIEEGGSDVRARLQNTDVDICSNAERGRARHWMTGDCAGIHESKELVLLLLPSEVLEKSWLLPLDDREDWLPTGDGELRAVASGGPYSSVADASLRIASNPPGTQQSSPA
jgi:hypothetical protein